MVMVVNAPYVHMGNGSFCSLELKGVWCIIIEMASLNIKTKVKSFFSGLQVSMKSVCMHLGT